MKHLMIKLILPACVGLFHSAQAAQLTVKLPNNSNIYTTALGSFFDADIYVDDSANLGNLNQFAGFDISLSYDSTNLSAESLISASIFGAETDPVAIANSITPGAGLGTINFVETLIFSAPSSSFLNITVPRLLGTVQFKALNVSNNNMLNITDLKLFNAGDLVNSSALGANIGITAAPAAAVPLPASALLFAPGLLAMFGVRKNKARKLTV